MMALLIKIRLGEEPLDSDPIEALITNGGQGCCACHLEHVAKIY